MLKINSNMIVGNCPKCGKPIYAPIITNSGENPATMYSCSCFMSKSFQETIYTKSLK